MGLVTPIILVLAVAGAVAAGQEGDPAAEPADSAALAKQFLEMGRAATLSKDSAKAAEAYRKALHYDAGLLEASYRLAKVRQADGAAQEAARHFRAYLKGAASRDRLTAAEQRWKTDAEAQLRRLDVYPKKWRALAAEWAKRFRALAASKGGLPSCVRALEIASALDDDEHVAAELTAAKGLLDALTPKLPAKGDPEGAKLLLDRAAAKRAAGETAEAVELLAGAVRLTRDPDPLVTLAELQLSLRKNAEAAAAAAAAEKLFEGKGGKERRKEYGPRVKAVLNRADPARAVVEALVRQFVPHAAALVRQSRAANDRDTAARIEAVVKKLTAPLKAAAGPAPGNRPKLSSQYVKVRVPTGARLTRTDDSIEYACVKGKALRGGAEALVGLARFHCGRNVSATWRIDQVAPKPVWTGSVSLGFLPSAGVRIAADNGIVDLSFTTRDSFLGKADEETRRGMYHKTGWYEVTFTKRGADVTIRVNQQELARFRMSAKRQAEVAAAPMVLWLAVDGRNGQALALRATLKRFTCSPDCIQPVPAPGGRRE